MESNKKHKVDYRNGRHNNYFEFPLYTYKICQKLMSFVSVPYKTIIMGMPECTFRCTVRKNWQANVNRNKMIC